MANATAARRPQPSTDKSSMIQPRGTGSRKRHHLRLRLSFTPEPSAASGLGSGDIPSAVGSGTAKRVPFDAKDRVAMGFKVLLLPKRAGSGRQMCIDVSAGFPAGYLAYAGAHAKRVHKTLTKTAAGLAAVSKTAPARGRLRALTNARDAWKGRCKSISSSRHHSHSRRYQQNAIWET